MLKKLVIRALVVIAALVVFGVAAIWFVARDEVAAVRSMADRGIDPVPPNVEAAIIAVGNPVLERSDFSWPATGRAWNPRMIACGPSPIAFTVVRSVSTPRRMIRWHAETYFAALVVERLYAPQQLFRIYAHNLYFGKVGGREIRGIGVASRVYFDKTPQELTIAEAATLAGMIPAPNVFSPLTHPDRALERRNKVLQEMRRKGVLNAAEFEHEKRSSL